MFNLFRYWAGLAQLLGIDGPLIPHLLQENDKTAQILKLWQAKDKENATIPYLLQCLEKLDRFDVIDDTADLIGISHFYECKYLTLHDLKLLTN